MQVEIAGLAWLERGMLSEQQIANIKRELTIYPKKTTDIQAKEPPKPIYLFEDDEGRGRLGVPRQYYLDRSSGDNTEILNVSYGEPMQDLATNFRSDGHFSEQADALRVLGNALEGKPWGGVMLQASPGFGKALANGEPVLTPDGYVPIESLEVGDKVAGTDGGFHNVTGVYPQGERSLVRLRFTRGLHVDCDWEHLWTFETYSGPITISTKELVSRWLNFGVSFWFPRVRQVTLESGVSIDASEISVTFIKSVEQIGKGEATCISVDSEDSLFLTRGCIPTHNTYTSLEFARRLGRRTLILVHKDFLVRQWIESINDLMPDANTGIIKQDKCEYAVNSDGKAPDFVVGLLQSLSKDIGNGKYPHEMPGVFGTIISDECFVAGTVVLTPDGKKNIEDVRLGEWVLNAKGSGPVDEISSQEVAIDDLRMVTMEGGHAVICTANHQFRADCGWVRAGDLMGSWVMTQAESLSRCNRIAGIRVESVVIPTIEDLNRAGVSVKLPTIEELERFGATDGIVRVHNIGVSGHPSYVLENNAVVHNCHRIGAGSWSGVIPRYRAAYRIGASVGPDSFVELRGGPFGDGWVGGIEDATGIAADYVQCENSDDHEYFRIGNLGVESRGWTGDGFGWKSVRTMIRHRCDSNVSEILAGSAKLLATDDHSIYRVAESGYRFVKNSKKMTSSLDCCSASDISKGDVCLSDDGRQWCEQGDQAIDVIDLLCKNYDNLGYVHVVVDLSGVSRGGIGASPKQWWKYKNSGKYGHRLPIRVYVENRDILPQPSRIYTEGASGAWISPTIKLSELAWVIGFFIGDGWISDNRFSLAVEDALVEEVSVRLSALSCVGWNISISERPGASCELRCSNSLFAKFMRSIIGYVDCGSKRLLGEWIISWPRQARIELLNGLVASDGSIQFVKNSYKRVAYTTTSKMLASDVCSLLRSLGVAGGRHVSPPSKGGIIDGRQIVGKRNRYQVSWSYNAMIGDNNGHNGMRRKFIHENMEFNEVNVRSVCRVDKPEYVYDFEMEGHPSFVADGILVHNSATLRRSDGAEGVFFKHISPVTYAATTKMMRPNLRTLTTSSTLSPIRRGDYYVSTDNLNSAQILNQLSADEYRTRVIVDDLVIGVCAGRKILVVSERLEHLKAMAEQLSTLLFDIELPFAPKLDFYTGQWFTGEVWEKTVRGKTGKVLHRKGDPKFKTRTPEELKAAEPANVLFVTKQNVFEGFNLPPVDVLVLATPMSDIEQIVGRVQRWCSPEPEKCNRLCPWRAGKCKGKLQPIVTDVVDEKINKMRSKHKRRRKFYKKIGMI